MTVSSIILAAARATPRGVSNYEDEAKSGLEHTAEYAKPRGILQTWTIFRSLLDLVILDELGYLPFSARYGSYRCVSVPQNSWPLRLSTADTGT